MAKKRTYPVRTEVVEKLRASRGMSLDTLAELSDVRVRTLRRIASGQEAFLGTIERIARALHTDPDTLRADVQPVASAATTRFSLDLSLKGECQDSSKLAVMVQLTPKIMALLGEHGIKVTEHRASLSLTEYAGDDTKRTIALIYGILAKGTPFWAFVAIRSFLYPVFLADQKADKIDMTQFAPYGEIIICGEGLGPDDETTVKTAHLYQTDPVRLLENVRLEMAGAVPVLNAALNRHQAASEPT